MKRLTMTLSDNEVETLNRVRDERQSASADAPRVTVEQLIRDAIRDLLGKQGM